MYLLNRENKMYELIFGECSRLICTDNKKKEDKIKLFRETNDGMTWIRKKCYPENEQFGIIGIQVAGNISFYIISI